MKVKENKLEISDTEISQLKRLHNKGEQSVREFMRKVLERDDTEKQQNRKSKDFFALYPQGLVFYLLQYAQVYGRGATSKERETFIIEDDEVCFIVYDILITCWCTHHGFILSYFDLTKEKP